MGIVDKIVLTLYAFALTLVSFFSLLVSLGWRRPLDRILEAIEIPGGRTAVGVISGFLLLASLRFIYFAFQRKPVQALVHDTGMGEVRISLVAVKSLVSRVASRTPGVREVKASVRTGDHGLVVSLELKVAVDANLPDLADKVQKAVTSYVRDIVGVNVESVKVSVSDIALEARR
ncbi:MAG TPA: alkaline shock response membrane anchor protein AmaP [Firmicutes bacterium]|nr:alkaline shock response membrane anchor protein AmaP [Candidatus Fermentithermobacillaceae bacterium]